MLIEQSFNLFAPEARLRVKAGWLPGLGVLMVVLTLGACKTDTLPELPGYEAYFPLSEGRYWEYSVDTIHYRETVENDTQRWLVRLECGAVFEDLEGLSTYPVSRYRRRTASDPWRYDNTWLMRKQEGRAEWVENNLRLIKLVFPLTESNTWQGHAFLSDLENIPVLESCNNFGFLYGWQYRTEGLHQPFNQDGWSFDSTVTVLQSGEQNLIEYNAGMEHYAIGVGLFRRDFYHLTTQTICPECPWSEKAECGYAVSERLTDWAE